MSLRQNKSKIPYFFCFFDCKFINIFSLAIYYTFFFVNKMIKNHISAIIKNHINHSPTLCQSTLIDSLAEFISDFSDRENKTVFLVKGYAGTGKTTVMSALVKSLPELKLKSVLLAPTGRAAKVLSAYAMQTASTIHKKIYRQKTMRDGIGEFDLNKNFHKNTIFIVDEASMIANSGGENSIFGSGKLLNDLLAFVYNNLGCKLILVGDTAQLPPVGLILSPALNGESLKELNFNVIEKTLNQVVRQSETSGILYNATIIRENINKKIYQYPQLNISDFDDVIKISGDRLIEEIENCYRKFGIDNTLVVCRSNKRANKYNEGIRRTILWRESELEVGDFLMIVKNNYFWLSENDKEIADFIANGDIVEVIRIRKQKKLYGYRFLDVSLRFIDYPDLEIEANVMLDTLNIDSASLGGNENNSFFFEVMKDYEHLKTKKKKINAVKENPYFNALQIKFSYAITCHKAQGGQWDAVFIDQGWIKDDKIDVEYLRWLYTAFTRPTKKLYLVNFDDKFFL